MKRAECFKDKYSTTLSQCTKDGVFKGKGANNSTDEWTWCLEHAPTPDFRVELMPETTEGGMNETR